MALGCEPSWRPPLHATPRRRAGAQEKHTAQQLTALFERSLADAPALPPFSYQVPGQLVLAAVRDALLSRGYTASRSAFDGDGAKAGSRRIRTNAPEEVRRSVGLGRGGNLAADGSEVAVPSA